MSRQLPYHRAGAQLVAVLGVEDYDRTGREAAVAHGPGSFSTQAESGTLARIESVLAALGGGDTCFQEERPFAYELRNFNSAILDTTVFTMGEALASL
jgi:hypothetical protein